MNWRLESLSLRLRHTNLEALLWTDHLRWHALLGAIAQALIAHAIIPASPLLLPQPQSTISLVFLVLVATSILRHSHILRNLLILELDLGITSW